MYNRKYLSSKVMVVVIVLAISMQFCLSGTPVEEQWYIFCRNTDEVDIQVLEMWKLMKKVRNKTQVTVAVLDTGVEEGNE